MLCLIEGADYIRLVLVLLVFLFLLLLAVSLKEQSRKRKDKNLQEWAVDHELRVLGGRIDSLERRTAGMLESGNFGPRKGIKYNLAKKGRQA